MPEEIEKLNKIAQKRMFYPLLDVCHLYIEHSFLIDKPAHSIRETIRRYCTYDEKYNQLHFSYCLGDGKGKSRHGVNFASNPKLLKSLLEETSKYPNINLILEISEIDYVNRPNQIELYNQIKELENTQHRNL